MVIYTIKDSVENIDFSLIYIELYREINQLDTYHAHA